MTLDIDEMKRHKGEMKCHLSHLTRDKAEETRDIADITRDIGVLTRHLVKCREVTRESALAPDFGVLYCPYLTNNA
jgi:hypothetical protein